MASIKLSVTLQRNLTAKYSAKHLALIERAIKAWIKADAQRGIRTIHVALDDPASMKKLGLSALRGAAAEDVKKKIDALWRKLAPDYLVLLGGEDVVPYFVVSNPSHSSGGDDDVEVPTDNPYACSQAYVKRNRKSYLVPDRVIGRVADLLEVDDPHWLVSQLNLAAGWTPKAARAYADTYAVCCETWRAAGEACVTFLGVDRSELLIAPPTRDGTASTSARLRRSVHIMKCHGSELDPNFYGESKKHDFEPVISSRSIRKQLRNNPIVAAMCCYGAQNFNPSDPAVLSAGELPIAAAYLGSGALGFAGSTKIAWVGSQDMQCADRVVTRYLRALKGGASLGRAFLEAKQDYVRVAQQDGVVLDRADEKTLIEYVLLGDPSLHPATSLGGDALGTRDGNGPHVAASPRARTLAMASTAAIRAERRVFRATLAVQLRAQLPNRARVSQRPGGRAVKLPEIAQLALGARATAVPAGVDLVVPPLSSRATAAAGYTRATVAAKLGRAAADVARAGERYQYYFTARQPDVERLVRLRMVTVETDAQGRVLRSRVVQSS